MLTQETPSIRNDRIVLYMPWQLILFYNELLVLQNTMNSTTPSAKCDEMKHDNLYQGVANNSWRSAWHDAAHILLLHLSESTCTMANNLQTKVVQHVYVLVRVLDSCRVKYM